MIRYPFVVEVVELVALIAEMFVHVTVDAGLPVTTHLNFAVIPSVSSVEGCIELATSKTCGAIISSQFDLIKMGKMFKNN